MSGKRHLSQEEIDDILDVITPSRSLPRATAHSIASINRQRLENLIKTVEIYPEKLEKFKREIKYYYQNTMIQPGESVGVITAQSIGERQTQMTLNTFHNCGQAIKTVVAGVPRFSELLNATANPKAVSCHVYFKQNTEKIDDLRRIIGYDFVEQSFESLVKSSTVFTEPKRELWYDMWESLYGNEHSNFTHGISFTMDLTKMFEYFIPLELIASKVREAFGDAHCVWSPDSLGVLDVWVDISHINNDEGLFHSVEEACNIYMKEVVEASIKKLHICGIPGVHSIFYEERQGSWMIETDGSNLRKIFAHPEVDMPRTMCNNVWEIYQTLGIEAARNFLVEEFGNVISADGTFVNLSHVLLLVDLMTFSGSIISVSRYGLKKDSCGPMAKASFEESLDNFLKAGAFSEKETTNGVSASIMLGKMARFGTGICDVLIDVEQLAEKPLILQDRVLEDMFAGLKVT